RTGFERCSNFSPPTGEVRRVRTERPHGGARCGRADGSEAADGPAGTRLVEPPPQRCGKRTSNRFPTLWRHTVPVASRGRERCPVGSCARGARGDGAFGKCVATCTDA